MGLTLAKPTIGLPGWGGTMNGNIDNIKAYADSVDAQMVNFAKTETVSYTYYVNVNTGNDNNDGLASNSAFKTFKHAISILPEITISGNVKIIIADGDYTGEASTYIYIIGKGICSDIRLTGNTSNPSACKLPSVFIRASACLIWFNGFEFVPTSSCEAGVHVSSTAYAVLQNCLIDGKSKSKSGVIAEQGSACNFSNSTFNNCSYGIAAKSNSIITSNTNSGSGNNYGLYSTTNAIIGKILSQPSGSTANEWTSNAGVIR